MDRYDFFFLQAVTEAQVDNAFERVEEALDRILPDAGLVGVLTGMGVTQHAGTPNLTVDVVAGTTSDANGQRINFAATQNPNLAVDHLGSSTAVTTGGKTKIVSLFVMFDRALSDLQLDGNSDPVYYSRAESFAFHVVQGAESSGTPVPPALDPEMILLADVTLSFGQTQILNANIATTGTARRQDAIVIAGTPLAIRRGKLANAISDIVAQVNTLAAGVPTTAVNISYAGGGTWADGTTNPAATAEAQFDKIISDLGTSAASSSVGAARIGLKTNLGGHLNGLTTVLAAITSINTDAGFKGDANTWTAQQTYTLPIAYTAALTRTRTLHLTPRLGAGWSIDGLFTGSPRGLVCGNAGADVEVDWPLRLPHGATLTNITAIVQGGPTHSSLPTNMPKFTLRWHNPATQTDGASTAQTDASASIAAFEAAHTIVKTSSFGTGTNPINNVDQRYWIDFQGESGASSKNNMVLYGFTVTFTLPAPDEAAA